MWGWSYRKEPIMANKKTAIKILKEKGIADLIERLLINGENESVMILVQACWGYTTEETIEYVKEEWTD
jgi:hypothetical protein